MESIIFVVGMLAAFLLGAYVRKPFPLNKQKKAENVANEKEKEYEDKINAEFEKLMQYTGRKREGDQ